MSSEDFQSRPTTLHLFTFTNQLDVFSACFFHIPYPRRGVVRNNGEGASEELFLMKKVAGYK